MQESGRGLKPHLRTLACHAVRGAFYVSFGLHKALSAGRPAIEPYLRRRARKRCRISSPLAAAGISILIHEPRSPHLLDVSLSSVLAACRLLPEPWEVLVLAEGAEESVFAELRRKFDAVHWVFSGALGFCDAVRVGLLAASHGWVYLMKSGMIMDTQALAELMPWRGPGVFAIASQVCSIEAGKHREETGWRCMVFSDGMVEFRSAPPECPDSMRGTLYAGAGAALFQRRLLQSLLNRKLAAPVASYEDIEWGIVAWKNGYASLFCPRSKVSRHRPESTSAVPAEREAAIGWRINQCRFQLRNPLPGRSDWDFLKSADAGALLGAAKGRALPAAIVHRLRSLFYPWDASILEHASSAWILEPPAPAGGKPTVVMVVPFCLFPPIHGGAVRITRLLEELRNDYRFVLLTDEGESYSPIDRGYFRLLASLHPITGRCESPSGTRPRIARIKSHSHKRLKNWLEWLLHFWNADLVQIEWMELAALLRHKPVRIPWVLTLHDVLLRETGDRLGREDRFELNLIRRYSAIITCCEEDAALLPGGIVRIVPNGMKADNIGYSPSSSEPAVLFMGSLRYKPNLHGIRLFLRCVYPCLRQRLPRLELWILGGTGEPELAAMTEEFHQVGVTVIDCVQDTRDWLKRCSLTINPLFATRGSCIKVLDSLSAGRVCISTRHGARGFHHAGLPQLKIVDTIEEFEPLLYDLLVRVDARHSVERPIPEHLARFAWRNAAGIQDRLYRELLRGRLP